ncbi:outer membrane transport energization protein ExbD [Flavobacterium aquaticum]|uniref:Outer membrane transport energization protein ExbD n=1 Tax=Flavobacterium aquaticum TaxID=1236486 RepID=A0A327YEU6_9FLAO|nr:MULTISPECIES: biopolymer transporter ExbD [Flavobacterium]MCK6608083.1 biopolymer transporter ExbD [Flavobacterium sp.]RAK19374.1 outer membrane transport energization protein ExbD [Flavobacterium aquaticum]TXI68077.1 MAG: biopolymer transporter ExbD [Flavobacterium sp.]
MRIGKNKNKVSTEFNMSSMTDIVFLLLIFFMLTSTMVTTNALDLVLPKAKGKTDSNKSTAVSIDEDLNFFIDKEKVNEADLENQLIALLANAENKAIILRAEKSVPHEKVVKVMDIAYRNQIKMVVAVNPK